MANACVNNTSSCGICGHNHSSKVKKRASRARMADEATTTGCTGISQAISASSKAIRSSGLVVATTRCPLSSRRASVSRFSTQDWPRQNLADSAVRCTQYAVAASLLSQIKERPNVAPQEAKVREFGFQHIQDDRKRYLPRFNHSSFPCFILSRSIVDAASGHCETRCDCGGSVRQWA